MTKQNNSPTLTLRDGALKISIWRQDGESGPFFTAFPSKTYEKDGSLHDGTSFVASDLLRLAELSREAYAEIKKLRALEPKNGNAKRLKAQLSSSAAPQPAT